MGRYGNGYADTDMVAGRRTSPSLNGGGRRRRKWTPCGRRASTSSLSRSTAARSPAASGARRGASTWSRLATSRTACRVAAPTSATDRSATWPSPRGRSRRRLPDRNSTHIEVSIKTLPRKKWTAIKGRCSGQIGSLLELLQGKLSDHVMEVVTDPQGRTVSVARRDVVPLQLPRLGQDVQTRGGRALWDRGSLGYQARVAVHAARRQSRGTDRRQCRESRGGGHVPRQVQAAGRGRNRRRLRDRARYRQRKYGRLVPHCSLRKEAGQDRSEERARSK